MEKIWNKFHPLFGSDLKVGLEFTYPRDAVLDLNPLYKKSGLIHKSPKESVARVCEPAIKTVGCCKTGRAAKVFFESPLHDKESLFRRLVFSRKSDSDNKPRLWMVFARHGEACHFGFDSWNSRSDRYLTLAFPGTGLDDQFIPAYVKIQAGKEEEFVYLELWAWSDSSRIVIQGRRVSICEAPQMLIGARPGC
ncbi:hypothetical protein HY838_01000 [Candidatus Azambacteria bacterium]|nr:hypothetical protein [Candidatus Azambacteria bacterium]